MVGEESSCFSSPSLSLSLSIHSLHLSQIHSAQFPIRFTPTVLSHTQLHSIDLLRAIHYIVANTCIIFVSQRHYIIGFFIRLLSKLNVNLHTVFMWQMESQVFIDWGQILTDIYCQCWRYLMLSSKNRRQIVLLYINNRFPITHSRLWQVIRVRFLVITCHNI